MNILKISVVSIILSYHDLHAAYARMPRSSMIILNFY